MNTRSRQCNFEKSTATYCNYLILQDLFGVSVAFAGVVPAALRAAGKNGALFAIHRHSHWSGLRVKE